MHRQGDWERYTTHVAQAKTMSDLPASFDEVVLAKLLAGNTVKIKDGARSLHLALVPLEDAGGHHIGELTLIRDISALEATFNGYMALVFFLCLLVAATLFLGFSRSPRTGGP